MLRIQHIVKQYAQHRALDDVSMDIEKGSIFGLLGPNGAGKTSLIRIINQITAPDSGEVFFNGEKLNPKHIAKIGYLPEERGLYKKMEIGEQALYLAQLKGLSRAEATKRIKYWFEKMDMQGWWNKKVEDLSKGMGQKLQFVTTVLHEPKLIILDEPFSGLDPVNANLIKDEIYSLAQRGCTIIFSTHRMEQVEEICDKIVLVNLGKKILDGTVQDVRQQFKENKFKIKLREIPANSNDNSFSILEAKANEFVVKINQGFKSNDVLQSFLQQGCIIESFNEILPSLNDIFINLVEGTKSTARAFQAVS